MTLHNYHRAQEMTDNRNTDLVTQNSRLSYDWETHLWLPQRLSY